VSFPVGSRVYREYRVIHSLQIIMSTGERFFAKLFTRSHNKRDGRPTGGRSTEETYYMVTCVSYSLQSSERGRNAVTNHSSQHSTVSFGVGRR